MKKIIFAVALLVLGVGLVACGSDEYEIVPNTPNEGPARGYWQGDTFASAYMGLRFDLPMGWEAEDEQLVRTAQGSPVAGWSSVFSGEPISASVLESGIPFSMMDMGAFFGIPTISGYISTGSVAIHITRPAEGESHEIQQMIDLGFWEITEEVVTIGRYEWQAYHAQGDSSSMQWSGFVRVDGDIYKAIAIIHSDMFSIDEILSYFRSY